MEVSGDGSGQTTPLGTIVWELEHELISQAPSEPSKEARQAIETVYRDFDQRYWQRPDYALWRTSIFPHYVHNRPWLAGPEPRFHQANLSPIKTYGYHCAESSDPAVLWSAVSIIPLINDRVSRYNSLGGELLDDPQVDKVLERLHGRLLYEPSPASYWRASCGVSKLHFLIWYQNRNRLRGRLLSPENCQIVVGHIKDSIRLIDPMWAPGAKINVDIVRDERRGRYRLLPTHDRHEVARLIVAMSTTQQIIETALHKACVLSEPLLQEAVAFSRTAWLLARSRRIHEYAFQRDRDFDLDSDQSREKRRRAVLSEVKCHFAYARALRNAAEYTEAAKQLYLVFRLLPDEFVADPEVKKTLEAKSSVFSKMGEVGLEIDRRFYLSRKTSQYKTRIKYSEKQATIQWTSLKAGKFRLNGVFKTRNTGYPLRLEKECDELPEWQVIAQEAPRNGVPAPLYYRVVKRALADAGLAADADTLAAAFQVFRRYGDIRSAAKIFSRAVYSDDFDLTATMVLDLVHSAGRCTQLDPFGMRLDRIGYWHQLIRDAVAKLLNLDPEGTFSADDMHWIHETILNRLHVPYRSLTHESARRLYDKAVGDHSDQELREFYDHEYNLLKRFAGAASTDAIGSFCAGHRNSSLGAPVAISLVLFGDFASLIGTNGNGDNLSRTVSVKNLEAELVDFWSSAPFWFQFPALDPSQQIIWPKALRIIAESIVSLAEDLDSAASVILLSIDTKLSQVPWQHYLSVNGYNDRLIAIVPNFSATIRDPKNAPDRAGLKTFLSDENSPEIIATRRSVQETTRGLNLSQTSVSIIVGHGVAGTPGVLPSVSLSEVQSIAELEDWAEVLGSDISVLHSCHTGGTVPVVMEELGGIVGLALNLGARSVLAPVSEVFPETAATLQKEMFTQHRGSEIGFAYLQAIERVPQCVLYTMFGDPYFTIT